MDEAKNQINYLDHKKAKNNQSEQEEKRIKKKTQMRIVSVSDLWDNCMVEKIQGLRSIIGRYKIGRGMLRIV